MAESPIHKQETPGSRRALKLDPHVTGATVLFYA